MRTFAAPPGFSSGDICPQSRPITLRSKAKTNKVIEQYITSTLLLTLVIIAGSLSQEIRKTSESLGCIQAHSTVVWRRRLFQSKPAQAAQPACSGHRVCSGNFRVARHKVPMDADDKPPPLV